MLHKFRGHSISKDTKILILGTFHPEGDTGANFFYRRPRNFLWRILPACYDYDDLKAEALFDIEIFMREFKIDFVDIIESLEGLPEGQEYNYKDNYIDNCVGINWKDIFQIIENLPDIEAVYFTRKTFTEIPNIHNRILQIKNYCMNKCIRFCFLDTPSRFCNQNKIQNWKNTIVEKSTCL